MIATTAPRWTEYGTETVGTANHTVKAKLEGDHWVLTLTRSPIQPQLPPRAVDLTGAEWSAFILAQSTPIASRRVSREFYGDMELDPVIAAQELTQHVMGTAYTLCHLGRGWRVELA